MMKSVDGSKSVGTSEADGRRRWSRCSKYDRNVSRISSEVNSGDCPASHHDISPQQDGGLSRGGAVDGLVQASDVAVERAGQRLGAVPQPDGVDVLRRAVQADV